VSGWDDLFLFSSVEGISHRVAGIEIGFDVAVQKQSHDGFRNMISEGGVL
jgi:hypothetical protein